MATATHDDEAAGADEAVVGYRTSRLYRFLDERLDLRDGFLGKAFPEARYASFLLGEVALFSLLIVGITGIFLGLLYNPSTATVTYHGNSLDFNGQQVPQAFASVLHLTYDVRAGMFVRMVHHWASYVFTAAIALHMMRVFFTGAYKKPREINWVVGSLMLLLALLEGFTGYALPYDNFSKTATGIGFEMAGSVPFIGSWLTHAVFGGDFPSQAAAVLPRLFFLHVFVLPAVLVGLLGAHLLILIRQKHTEQPSVTRAEEDAPDPDDRGVVVGMPLVPSQAVVSTVVALTTAAVISLLAGFFPVQNILATGPANPSTVPPGVGPDWYLMWVFGLLKLMPSSIVGAYSRLLGGILLPGLIVTILVLWPFLDLSRQSHAYIENPLAHPKRTGFGIGGIVLVLMLSVMGMNETVASLLGTTTDAIYWPLAILTVTVPVVAGLLVWWVLRPRGGGRASERSPSGSTQRGGGGTSARN